MEFKRRTYRGHRGKQHSENGFGSIFTFNNTPEVRVATVWEAHKAYIRGKLISIGARKKDKKIKHEKINN